MGKIKKQIGKFKENFAKKTMRRKILFCIGLSLLLTFLFFVIKGNFFDVRTVPQTETSLSADNSENSDSLQEQTTQAQDDKVHFHINWIDVGILAALCAAYGVHKYREKKREKRL